MLAAAKKKKKNNKKKANGKTADAAESNGVKDQPVADEEEEDDDDDERPETAAVCANVDAGRNESNVRLGCKRTGAVEDRGHPTHAIFTTRSPVTSRGSP